MAIWKMILVVKSPDEDPQVSSTEIWAPNLLRLCLQQEGGPRERLNKKQCRIQDGQQDYLLFIDI